MTLTLTYPLAMAAAEDAANRHMLAAGRDVWSADDYDVACAELARLWPEGAR